MNSEGTQINKKRLKDNEICSPQERYERLSSKISLHSAQRKKPYDKKINITERGTTKDAINRLIEYEIGRQR